MITWNNRILTVNVDGNPKKTTITHYSPCEGSETAESQYADLTNATALIPKHNFLIGMGDFNAHLASTPENKNTYHDKTNLNGQLLYDYSHICIYAYIAYMLNFNTNLNTYQDRFKYILYVDIIKSELNQALTLNYYSSRLIF